MNEKSEKMDKKLEERDKTIENMGKTIEKLVKTLKIHDNSNTPPSKRLPASNTKPRNGNGAGRKQGGQKGHTGKTSKPKPTKFENHKSEKCPDCNSDNLEVTDTAIHDVTDIKKTIQSTTTHHTLETCRCLDCGRHGITANMRGTVPKEGNYGPGIIRDITSLYESRMPVKMISRNSERDMGIHISTGSICNILGRLGTCLDKPAKHILAIPYDSQNTTRR